MAVPRHSSIGEGVGVEPATCYRKAGRYWMSLKAISRILLGFRKTASDRGRIIGIGRSRIKVSSGFVHSGMLSTAASEWEPL